MRTQKAIARIQADSFGDGSGEMDLTTLAMQVLPMLAQRGQPPVQPQATDPANGPGLNMTGNTPVYTE